MTLYFYRNYVTFFNLGIIYKLDESNAYRWVRWTEAELPKTLKLLADSGYQGIKGLFEKSLTPKKKSKNNPLSTTDKELNKLISSIRNINRTSKLSTEDF